MSTKTSFIPIKPCQKFNSFKTEPDCENAVTYVSLRKKGCPIKKAVHFCSKSLCRNDSTKVNDGPSNFRVLKVKPASKVQINGWNLMNPQYDLRPFLQSYKELVQEDKQEKMLQKHFIMNEDKGREDFKKRVSSLAKYYSDLNTEYNFSGLDRRSLIRKLREKKQEFYNERFKKKHYYLMDDLKLFTLGEEAHQDSCHETTKKSIISQMNVFSLTQVNKEGLNLLEESSDDEENKDKVNDDLTKASSLLPKIRKKTEFDESNPRRLGQFLSPENLERLKKKSMIFYNLEVQAQFLNHITNMENISDSPTLNPSESKLLKLPVRKSIIQEGSSLVANQIAGLNFDSKKFAEEEFNKSKYLTMSSKSQPKRVSMLSSEIRNKLKRRTLVKNSRTSTFFSNIDPEEIEDDDFNKTLNKIVRKNIDFWEKYTKQKKNVDNKCLNEILEKRKGLKQKYLGKMLSEEENNPKTKKGYMNFYENMSISTTIPIFKE